MTLLVCEPIIHAVAYCENKAFFKQASESLIQGLLPGEDEEEPELEIDEEMGSGEEEEEEDPEEDSEEEEEEDSGEIESFGSISGEEVEFNSEEFDSIKDDHIHESGYSCCEHDHEHEDDDEDDVLIFDYTLLSKFIFDFGAREDVLVRNRRFLYELSQIIEEISTAGTESCCHEGETCCN